MKINGEITEYHLDPLIIQKLTDVIVCIFMEVMNWDLKAVLILEITWINSLLISRTAVNR